MKFFSAIVVALLVVASFIGFKKFAQKDVVKAFQSRTPQSVEGCTKENYNFKFAEAETEQGIIETFNACILAVQTKKEVHNTIVNIVKEAKETKHKEKIGVVLYGALLKPILKLEGIIWRLRSIGEKSDIVHMSVLGQIRKIYYRHELAGQHVTAFVKYITEPTEKPNHEMFISTSAVQDFLTNEFGKELKMSLNKVDGLIQNGNQNWEMSLDQTIFTGDKFISKNRARKDVIFANLYFIKSGIERLLGGINYISAYNLEELMFFANDLVKVSAINTKLGKGISKARGNYDRFWKGIFGQQYETIRKRLESHTISQAFPEVVTPYEIRKILNEKRYSKFLTKRTDAKLKLDESFNYFKASVDSEREAFVRTVATAPISQGDRFFVDPRQLAINHDKTLRKLNERKEIFEKAANDIVFEGNSEATGEEFQINVRSLFKPKDDLKDYFPVGFYRQNLRKGHIQAEKNGTVYAWNYLYGRPNKWKHPDFDGLIPNATSKNLYQKLKVLTLTPSTAAFTAFLPAPGLAFLRMVVE